MGLDFLQLIQAVGLGVALLLPMANPLTSMALLLSLGNKMPYQERQKQIKQATLYVFCIMAVTYYAGAWIMQTFGISIPGMRIAGGLIVLVIGFSMLFPTSNIDETVEAEAVSEDLSRRKPTNIAFVPLALPGTAGPGTIAMIISGAASITPAVKASYTPWVLSLTPVLVFLLLSLLFWVCLRFAQKIVGLVGIQGIEALSRVMGFLMICMAVQFVINGVLEIAAGQVTLPSI